MEASVGWHFASRSPGDTSVTARTPEQAVAESAAVSWLFGLCGTTAGLSSVMFFIEVLGGAEFIRLLKGLMWLAFAGLSAYLFFRKQRRTGGLVTFYGLLAVSCLVVSSAVQGYGLRAPGMMFVPLFVLAIAILGSARRTAWVTLWALVCFLALGFGQPPLPDQASIYPPNHSAIILGVMFVITAAGLGHSYASVIRSQIDLASLQARRLQQLIEQLPVGVMVHEGGRVRDMNPKARTLFDLSPGEVVAGLDLDRITRQAHPLEGSPDQKLFDQHRISPVRFDLQRESGDIHTLESVSIRLEDAESTGIVTVLTDETERLHAQEALLEQKLTLSSILEFSPMAVLLVDEDSGTIRVTNAATMDHFGLPRDRLLNRTLSSLPAWKDRGIMERVRAALDGQDSAYKIEVEAFGATGGDLTLDFAARRLSIGGKNHILLKGQDVTGERALRRELLSVINTSLIGVCLVRYGAVTICNARFEEMMGWAPGSGVGKRSEDAFTPAIRAEVRARHLDKLKAGEQVEIQLPINRADGVNATARFMGQLIQPGARDGFSVVWLAEDITDVAERQALLEQARLDAESASRAMSSFLAEMSHEIRTPLNGVIGLTDLMRQPGVDPAEREEYLRLLQASASTLSGVITDVLDLSKIEAGKVEIENCPVDLHEVLQGLADTYAPLARARGLAFVLDIEPALVRHILGDRMRLHQILNNFLANALKFTLEGYLQLQARVMDDQRVRLVVHDSGPGVSAQAQSQLFQPFSQVRGEGARSRGGTGLGLFICRQLAELMGGVVGVRSEPGRGSSFWFEFTPVRCDAQLGRPTGPVPTPPQALRGLKILVAEDNKVGMLVLDKMLRQVGAEVVQAVNGVQALEAVVRACREGRPFDLALLDVEMPEMDGLQAIRALRRMPEGQPLVAVALTASAMMEDRDDALAAGMNDFLTKPLRAERLVAAVLRHARPHVSSGTPSVGERT